LKFELSKAKAPHSSKIVANTPAPDLLTSRSENSLLPLNSMVVANSHLPVPPAAGQAQSSDDSTKMTPVTTESGLPIEGSGKGLLAISTEPTEKLGDIALPPGNRLGEFSISPVGGKAGSPGGAPNGTPNGGTTGNGSGGDGSFGIGSGKSGVGGGSNGEKGSLSIVGSPNGPAGENLLGRGPVSNMVYPLPAALLPRKNALVIYTGPTGGGSLNVYKALSCGKIFSIFLRMPGKPWSLQYCPVSSKAPETDNKPSQTMVVTMPQGVVPPEAIKQFDFRRLPLPPEKLHKFIVLKGLIHEDGSVDKVTVYQGLLPAMDEAAKLAVSQWKFKPALRNGKPIELEVLVGIPSDRPPGQVEGKSF
jgi:TonB-like protein